MELVERPVGNKRSIHEDMDWDRDLERALETTLINGLAVRVDLALFHSSPAKGRIWKRGLKLKHRVLSDRQTVLAWVELESIVEGDQR